MSEGKKIKCLSAFDLKIIAMALMFCDHLWATLVPGKMWLTCLGRIAFPIFAFQIAEGFSKTGNFKKYISRIFICALLSEIPFNLMSGGGIFFPFHQNVLFSFTISLLLLRMIQWGREKSRGWFIGMTVLSFVLATVLGLLCFVDYFNFGIYMVICFYLLRGLKFEWLGQLVMMYIINVSMMQGMWIDQSLFGFKYQVPLQGYALLALIPIWLYNSKKGHDSMAFRIVNYAFYPVHILILSVAALYM